MSNNNNAETKNICESIVFTLGQHTFILFNVLQRSPFAQSPKKMAWLLFKQYSIRCINFELDLPITSSPTNLKIDYIICGIDHTQTPIHVHTKKSARISMSKKKEFFS